MWFPPLRRARPPGRSNAATPCSIVFHAKLDRHIDPYCQKLFAALAASREACPEIGLNPRQLFGGRQLEADLALGHLAQRGVLGGKLLERLDQRAMAAAELFHAARNHVHQDIGVLDNFERFLQVIVSHGWNDWVISTRFSAEFVILETGRPEDDVYRRPRRAARRIRSRAIQLG